MDRIPAKKIAYGFDSLVQDRVIDTSIERISDSEYKIVFKNFYTEVELGFVSFKYMMAQGTSIGNDPLLITFEFIDSPRLSLPIYTWYKVTEISNFIYMLVEPYIKPKVV